VSERGFISDIRRKWIAKFPNAFRGAGLNVSTHICEIAQRSLAKLTR
jgi:hypothetical protein